ncbi:transcriptional regulator SdiA [Salmonella enterica subsp. enterica serovar Enteritidis]|nr:transcriptional regulator SdiA [Salmonella enterica subsp. enterica serovar Enteritidis]
MQENDFFTWRRAMLLRFQEMAAAEDVYTELQYQTQRLEFDYYALCVRHPVPFTRPKISLRTTYPPAWVTHYQSENYFAIDPVLKPENFRQGHLHWDDVLFHEAQAMWDAAQRFGLRRGVTQCVMLPNRALGFLSFSRSSLRCSSFTYDEVELRLQLLARTNAATALITKLSQQSTITQRLTALAAVLKLPAIKRMECFDISHTMGEQTVASCVVFDANGPLRAEYRRYNIAGITPGDDYAAMNQVLRRRYGKAIEESKIPDVILIDGGKGQLAQAKAVFAELDVPWDKHRPLLLGVAKGADRKAGLEILFFEPEGEGFSLPPDSPALHVIQHIRDESHDHAIGGHRKKRAKVKNTSTLETIEGVGPKRRQMLLKYMGGLQGLRNASVEEIAKVPGISQGLAEKIFWSLKH